MFVVIGGYLLSITIWLLSFYALQHNQDYYF